MRERESMEDFIEFVGNVQIKIKSFYIKPRNLLETQVPQMPKSKPTNFFFVLHKTQKSKH